MDKPKIRFAGASDPGRVRHNNEDALYLDAERGIVLVVDGIGGQAAGEKAAEIAVDRVRTRLERQTGTAEQRIREAIAMANNEILRAAKGNPEWEGMACVLTVAVLENGSAVLGHVGDSRLYQIREGRIRKVTHDHSPVGEREDKGELSEAEAMRHPRRNEVFRDVGSEEHQPDDPDFIEVQRIPFDAQTALLLCSDGLSDQVASQEIRQAVERHAGNPDAAVRDLIAAANQAGGKDNVTVALVEGEGFTAPAGAATAPALPAPEPQRQGSSLAGKLLWFVCGVIAAAAAVWFSRSYWVPPPVVEKPRTLVTGTGAEYPTIAAALSAARPGDIIDVVAGEYPEQVHLVSGVTLRSRESLAAIVRAAPLNDGPAVIADKVTGARFQGFRILASPDAPVSTGILLQDSHVEIEDVEIDGARVGIEIRGPASPTVRGSTIHDCSNEGVLIQGPSQPWISHNEIKRNKGAGLSARDGAHPILVGNVFEKNWLDIPPDMLPAVKQQNRLLDGVLTARPPATAAPPAARKKE